MRIVYQDERITLLRGLWQDVLPTLDPASIDALITDSPYGTTQLEWDIPVDWSQFWPALYRVCKPSAVQVMFSAQPFTTDLINSNRANYRYELIWPKTMPTGFLDANRRPLRAHENIQIFSKALGSTAYNPQKVPGVPYKIIQLGQSSAAHYSNKTLRTSSESDERHPTTVLPSFSKGFQPDSLHETGKPLALMMWLVATYTNPGDLVLDPFMGSGSTAEACKKLGRRCIGIEMREQPLEVAARRLSQDVMELAL